MPKHYVMLLLAILTETVGTTALNASQQFTRIGPVIVLALAYGASFYFMAQALRVMPVGIVYAIWSGLGIVLIAVMGFVVFGQRLDLPALLGLALIVAGVLVIHLFSNSAAH